MLGVFINFINFINFVQVFVIIYAVFVCKNSVLSFLFLLLPPPPLFLGGVCYFVCLFVF